MKTNLDRVDELTEALKALQPIKPEFQKKLDQKFRLEFNYNSNHLEGNTLTYGETELLLIFDDTTGNHTMREYEEMKAHDVAYRLVEDWAKESERPLTEQSIKNLNEIILVRPFWKEAITPDGQNTRRKIIVGNYKEQPNSVLLANGEIFEYASPAETPFLMQELIEWYRIEEKALHPVTLAAMLHYKFVSIHPFDDGNGRVSRLLMNYVLLKNGFPPVIIKSEDKRNYLGALHLADIGNYEPIIDYIAKQLVWSLEISVKATKGEDLEEAGDLQKEIALLNKRFTTDKKLSKHPAIIYQIFKWFDKEVWSAVAQTLSEFETLFAERKEFHFVNMLQETYERKNMLDVAFMKSSGPEKIKIFGKDIYEEDIEKIEWKLIMYGLKGVKAKPNIKVKSLLEFHTNIFYINLLIGYDSVVSEQFHYGDYMLPSDIEKLKSKLAKRMLEVIKERIE